MPLLDFAYQGRESSSTLGEDTSGEDKFNFLQHSVFGILTLIYFTIGVPGGSMSLFYFLSKQNKTINTHLFILINITDVMICFLMVFVGISHFAQGESMFQYVVFCNMWAMFWQVCIRMSVFLVGVLSITRVISILKPFKTIRVGSVLIAIASYLALLFIQSTVPFWTNDWPVESQNGSGDLYIFRQDLSRCSWNSTAHLGCSSLDKTYSTIHMLIEWALPVLPVLASCIILVYKLQCKPSAHRLEEAHSVTSTGNIRRESTITVVILTAIYLGCSTFSAVWQFCLYIDYLVKCGSDKERLTTTLDYMFQTLITTYFIPLNSVLNTIVYFCRIKGLRAYAYRVLRLEKCVKNQSVPVRDNQEKIELSSYH